MKRQISLIILFIFSILTLSMFYTANLEATQEEVQYTSISTAEEWRTLITENPAGNFKLENDIDLGGGWVTPTSGSMLCSTFTGVLDGQGYAVKNGLMPSGWAQPAAIAVNQGTIKNLALINITGGNLSTDTGFVQDNQGTIENLFVKWIINSNETEYGFAGVISGYSGTGEIKNSIVVLSLGSELTTAPSFQGSIVGKANAWASKITNSYAIVNGTGVTDIAATESEGVLSYVKEQGNSRQFETYQLFQAQADVSTYDTTAWAFTNTAITFFGRNVYEVENTEYTEISTVEEFLTLIKANTSGNFKLVNDLDFNGGYITGADATFLASIFSGELDGQGFKIKNAKLPGGWNGHALFSENQGKIKNIAFINLLSNKVATNIALIGSNKGIIENIYIDYALVTETYSSSYNGVIAANADNQLSNDKPSIIRNCIVNVRLEEGATLPSNQGSIIGVAGGWTGYVKNCYAIVNDTGIEKTYGKISSANVANETCKTSAQFTNYKMLKADADLSMYNNAVWSFTDTTISFFGNAVYTHECVYSSVVTPPTCIQGGYTTYICTCGHSYISDEVDALGHTLVKVDAVAPTCTTAGKVEHYKCSECNKLFSDEAGTNEITLESTVVAAGHTLVKVDAVAPTCTTAGKVEHYKCSECNKLFSDEAGTNEITLESTVVAARHTLVKVDAVAPTCTTAGKVEHYKCSECNKLFSDEAGTNEITLESTVVAALGHTYDDDNDGTCNVCGETREIEDTPATGCGRNSIEMVYKLLYLIPFTFIIMFIRRRKSL